MGGFKGPRFNKPKSMLMKLAESLQARDLDKKLVEERRVKKAREDLADQQDFQNKITAGTAGLSALQSIAGWINKDEATKANELLTERYLGMTPQGPAGMSMYETSDLYKNTGWWEGHLPFGKKPKYAIPGHAEEGGRLQKTAEYQEWLDQGSTDYSDWVATDSGWQDPKQQLIDSWTAENPTFKVAETQGIEQHIKTPDILGGEVPISPVATIDSAPITDYIMDESTILAGDISQELGITKNSRGQIVDLESGAVMDKQLVEARIEHRKSNIDLRPEEKPAITNIEPETVKSKKLEGWKGKLGIYDTQTGFQATGQEGNLGWGGTGGKGWVEQADGSLAYETGLGDIAGGALAIYSIYDNIENTDWGGDRIADDVGAGLQIVGSALYFVPVPGARVVGTALNVVGAGVEHFGERDKDWWFGENSVWGKLGF